MPEYIYPDDELDIDENEVFVGFIRKNCEQLIRCIDCKHRDTYECMGRDAFYGLKDDDFCSWGERK